MANQDQPKPDSEKWTIGRLLNWTTDFFTQRGIESARLEAEVLLAHCRACKRIMLYTAFEEAADDSLRDSFRQLVRQRADGTPVAYLVGVKEFYSLDFEVTPNVLIPRPETELLVVNCIDLAKQRSEAGQGGDISALRIADVGTGSGILAVCIAKHLPQSQVTAIDISPAALDVARRNADRHGVDAQVEFLEGDLLEGLGSDARFDIIVSNPPYVTSEEMLSLDKTVRDYEPHLALDGGGDGTQIVGHLIQQSQHRLGPDGRLLVEISPTIVGQVENLLDESSLDRLPTINDLAGRARVVHAKRGASE